MRHERGRTSTTPRKSANKYDTKCRGERLVQMGIARQASEQAEVE